MRFTSGARILAVVGCGSRGKAPGREQASLDFCWSTVSLLGPWAMQEMSPWFWDWNVWLAVSKVNEPWVSSPGWHYFISTVHSGSGVSAGSSSEHRVVPVFWLGVFSSLFLSCLLLLSEEVLGTQPYFWLSHKMRNCHWLESCVFLSLTYFSELWDTPSLKFLEEARGRSFYSEQSDCI